MEVWNVVLKSNEQLNKGDFDGYFANIHDDYQGWNNHIPLPVDKALYKQMMPSAEMMESFKLSYSTVNPPRIVVLDDIAVAHYVFSWSGTNKNDEGTVPISSSGKNTEFYVKEGGKWLLIGDMTFIHNDDNNDDD
jgi:hypothetical protein